jgi:PAS domain S-box-containing protein
MAFFWWDVAALAVAAVLALVLTLLAMGSAPRERLSQLFALYTLSTAAFSALAVLLRLSLWLNRGDSELLGQLGTLLFIFSGPPLLLFAAHYVGLLSRWVIAGAAAGILYTCVVVLPVVFQGHITYGHILDANGTTRVQLTPLGAFSSILPIAYFIWSLVFFWSRRRRADERYMALSTFALLLGIVGGILLDLPVPLLSFAILTSLMVLGYGVLSVQLFNPLRERNLALQLEIAERRRAEGEILRLQHLLQAIANSMPSALITLDLDGRVLTWNPAAESLTGISAEAMLGQPCWDRWPDMLAYRDLIELVMETREAVRRNRDPLKMGDRTYYRDIEVFPLISNGVTGVVLRIADVSRRVHFETLALQTAKMVSVGRLATGLAHELNNPLGAILQGLQMLGLMLDSEHDSSRARMEAAGVDPEAHSRYVSARTIPVYLEEMRMAGERAAQIVSDLLEFSQKSEFEMQAHDLNALLRTTLDLAAADYDLRRQYDFREIELIWDLAPDLPQVVCNAPQIQQVILNLVQNAGYAMAVAPAPPETAVRRPRLVLRTRRDDQMVRLSIADSGPGIDPVVRERLFEPFLTTRGVGEGSGLGLWLCWSIVVEQHQGRIWLEQSDVDGACFVVELPIAGASLLDDAVSVSTALG